MSGIAGILLQAENINALQHLKRMTDTLIHRGANSVSYWSNKKNTIHLGCRHTHISEKQFINPTALTLRYQIVYDVQIYNLLEIKVFLQNKGYQFLSQSENEVLLAAYDYWKERCLQHFDGKFSLAIWDEKEEQFFAARDRFGEKPFYFYEDEDNFIFSSEMKALWAVGIQKKVDHKMLLNYLTLGHVQNCVDKEQVFFKKIYALPPSHYLILNPRKSAVSKITKYWGINKETKIDLVLNDAIAIFDDLFQTSVHRRIRNVPSLGISLSGGINSGSIVAIANSIKSNSTITAFSACYPDNSISEYSLLNLCKNKFSISGYEVNPSVNDLINNFEKICYYQEEPFPSSEIFPQYLVFENAKNQQINILLDGHGANETLAGYSGYIHWYLQEVLSRHKLGATQKELTAFKNNKQDFIWGYKNYLAAFLPSHAAMRLEKREYLKTIHHPYLHPDFAKQIKGHEWEGIHKPIVTKLNDILYFSTVEMGLYELLRFTDRNSMAHGIETRMPFLNHQLVEFIFSLPSQLKMHDGWTKFLLRKAMDKKIPKEIVWRKDRIGFEPPQKKWMLEKPLQEFVYVAKQKLVQNGVLSKKVLDIPITAAGVTERNNYDWRYLCAAQFL